MTFWRWMLSAAAGACGGWLAAQATTEEPSSARIATRSSGEMPEGETVGRASREASPGANRAAVTENAAAKLADRAFAEAEELIARIENAGAEELQALHESGKIEYSSVSGLLARRAVMQRWVEIDPEKGLLWLMGKNDGEERELLSTWLRADHSRAMAWALEHPSADPCQDQRFSSSADELRDFLLAAVAHPKALNSRGGSNLPLGLLAQLNPAAAREVFAALAPNDPRRAAMAGELARGLIAGDPEGALAWLQEQKPENGVIADMLRNLAYRHPDIALREIENNGLLEAQKQELRDVLAKGMARKSPEALRDFLSSLPDGSIGASNFVNTSGLSAGAWPLTEMHSLVNEMIRTGMQVQGPSLWDWTGRDPAQEFIAAASLPDDAGRTKILESLRGAAILSGSLPRPVEMAGLPDAVRGKTAQMFAEVASAMGNTESARQWAALVPAATIVERLKKPPGDYGTVTYSDAMALYAGLAPGERRLCTASVAEKIACNSPQEALAWADTLTPEELPVAWEGIAGGLAAADEAVAAEWVGSLPNDASRDGAVSQLTKHLVFSDPEASVEWALTIRDPAIRRASLAKVAVSWSDSDREAAAGTFREAEMSSEDRAAVNEALQKKEAKN